MSSVTDVDRKKAWIAVRQMDSGERFFFAAPLLFLLAICGASGSNCATLGGVCCIERLLATP